MADEDITKRTKGDVAHAVAKAGLSSIPVVGGAAAELFQFVVEPPMDRRRRAWIASVGERLAELEKNGLDLASLQENDDFVSAVLQCSQIALRTHNEEKLNCLRNAIANIAVGQGPDEALQHMFLALVDDFSELHIRILKYFQAPAPGQNVSIGSLRSVLEQHLPELRGRRAVYDQIWKDLRARGLVSTDTLHGMMTGAGLESKRTTELGDSFVHFVSG